MADEELYDVPILPGTPRSIIFDIKKKFDVEVVERKMPLYFANMDGTEREVLVFRGKREVVEQVEKELNKRLAEYIEKDAPPPGYVPKFTPREPEKPPE